MNITLARHSGFCMGVRNAILRIVQEINSSNEELCVYGPLIHNPQTIEVLNGRGLKTISSLENITGKRVAIRTHGIQVQENMLLKQCASRVINLTCPRVASVQSIIKKNSAKGCHTIITGDKDHAEVISLKSYASCGVTVISDLNETDQVPDAGAYILVSQTTFDRELFKKIVGRLKLKNLSMTVVDTICDSTRLRQEDVLAGILSDNDTLVVVGGKNSANTKRLAQIGRENNVKTFHVETEDELKEEDFVNSRSVLVTAGTSTPGWIINNVLDKLYTIKFKKSNIFLKGAIFLTEFIVRTNILSSAAASILTLTAMSYSMITADYYLSILSYLYIFSMYSINNYFERKTLKLSNPYKYVIYEKYGIPLLIISLASMAASLMISWQYNVLTVAIVAGSYLMGFLYSTNPVKSAVSFLNIGVLTKLYRSKLVTCFGWIIITVLLPLMKERIMLMELVAMSVLVFTLIFLRTIILDLIAFNGDLIIGRESLPIWLGIKNIKLLSYAVSACGGGIFCVLTAMLGEYGYLILLLNIAYYVLLMSIINRLNYLISLKYELLVDINFIAIIAFYFIIFNAY